MRFLLAVLRRSCPHFDANLRRVKEYMHISATACSSRIKQMQAELENLAWHNAPLTAFLSLPTAVTLVVVTAFLDRSKSQPKAHDCLSDSVISRSFEQLKDLGVMQVCLTGGEPLVYRDLLPLCQFGSNLGLFLSLRPMVRGFHSRSYKSL